jgi:hypothetical protein
MLWKNTKTCQENCKSRVDVRKLMIVTMLLVVLASGAAVSISPAMPGPSRHHIFKPAFISARVTIQSSARTMARTVPALTSRRLKRASRRTACS